MKTLVLILAQGQQNRLPRLTVAKQLLQLPACDNAPILYRTVRQVWAMLGVEQEVTDDLKVRIVDSGHDVRLVTWFSTYEALAREPGFAVSTSLTVLDDPGNSSLKGLARAMDLLLTSQAQWWWEQHDRVVVLLGDVVYSWTCLRALLSTSTPAVFVGTSDLSNSGGELWGFSWRSSVHSVVRDWISKAVESHPKFTAYQPGQLRRVLWKAKEMASGSDCLPPIYEAVDDYTRDIDLPEHLDLLPGLSRAAYDDDLKHGMVW